MTLQQVIEVANQSCQYLRLGCEAQGIEALGIFSLKVGPFVDSLNPTDYEYAVAYLKLIVDAQQRRDFIYIADIIEYELLKVLSEINAEPKQ